MPRKSRAKPDATQGRPTKGADALVAVLACKVTDAERDAVRAAAKAAGLDVSAWLRRAAQVELGRIALSRAVEAAIEEAGQLRREMGRQTETISQETAQ